MITLARHIELLLLEHDCIIVPGLGGFIANNASARYNENGDNLFLPPYRNIGFNQKLQANDGLLVQAYMVAYDASYPDAYKQMEMDIADVLFELDTDGSYELPNIGVLHKGINGIITFTSFDSGILTPSLYGLYSFAIKNKEEVLKEKQLSKVLQTTNVLPIQTEETYREVANNVAEGQTKTTNSDNSRKTTYNKIVDVSIAVAASVLLFFIFSYPTIHNNTDSETYVASTIKVTNEQPSHKVVTAPRIATTEQTEKVAEPNENINTSVETEATVASPVMQETGANKKQETVTANSTDNQEFVGNYTIILASCVAKNNAEDLIMRLEKEGFPEAKFITGEKMNRIIYSAFETFEEASAELSTLRLLSSHFKDAWIYENKANKK